MDRVGTVPIGPNDFSQIVYAYRLLLLYIGHAHIFEGLVVMPFDCS